MTDPSTAHTLPAANFLHLLSLVQRWGVSEQDVLAGLPFGAKELADPQMTISVPAAVSLLERARALTREPGLGVYLGLQTYAGQYGYLGFAAMTAPTLREALELIVKYAPVRSTAFAFSLKTDGSRAALVVEERADFGTARDIVLLSLLIGFRRTASLHLGRESQTTVIHLSLPEPPYYHRFRDLKPEVRFGRRANELSFDAAILDAPLATADPVSLQLAREQCEQMLEAVSSGTRLIDRVGRLVLRSDGGQRSCEEVASLLETSPRTLRRRLAEEGTTFLAVRDQELRDRALVLLRSSELSLSQIATRLGYANGANFLRAFRKWTGHAATRYRPHE